MQGRRADSSRGQQGHLTFIAPRHEAGPSGSHPASSAQSNIRPESRRSRLPPRSRSGCWTCRTRKVKCDEQRPACGQCVRLGHSCDYTSRLSFRDDTPRVIERMQEDVSAEGNSVWDPDASHLDHSQDRSTEDLLPPFSTLTTDEERERKAELQDPGTYHVIANPSSFSSLAEYRNNEGPTPGLISRSEYFTSTTLDNDNNSPLENVDDPKDPNVVILKTFEEPIRKVPMQPSNRSTYSASPASSQVSISHPLQSTTQTYAHNLGNQDLSTLDIARNGGRDARLLQHYRTTISSHIFQTQRSDTDEDLFEIHARTYPPLFHAMMALAALNMAHQSGAHTADALEHYQSVIPALKSTVQSSQDSYSDGALFTHFILLLYEIAAAGNRESNMWQHHSDQLLRIVTLRKQTNGIEPHDFIVWVICCIDIYALLSVSGTGIFIESLLKQSMLPAPETCLPPVFRGQAPHIYPEERCFFPALLKLNQDILLVALQVGQMARDLRAETTRRDYGGPGEVISESLYLMNRQIRIQNLHSLLEHSRSTWSARFPDYWTWISGPEPPPPRVFAWIKHSYMLFRACTIYAYTSMYPNQLRDCGPEFNSQVATCATEIIQAARMIVSQERFELPFIVFPLFMAGFATKDSTEKELTLGLIRTIEPHSYGRSTESVRRLLETIYEKRYAAALATGNTTYVDWVEEMELSGQHMIIYGL